MKPPLHWIFEELLGFRTYEAKPKGARYLVIESREDQWTGSYTPTRAYGHATRLTEGRTLEDAQAACAEHWQKLED